MAKQLTPKEQFVQGMSDAELQDFIVKLDKYDIILGKILQVLSEGRRGADLLYSYALDVKILRAKFLDLKRVLLKESEKDDLESYRAKAEEFETLANAYRIRAEEAEKLLDDAQKRLSEE